MRTRRSIRPFGAPSCVGRGLYAFHDVRYRQSIVTTTEQSATVRSIAYGGALLPRASHGNHQVGISGGQGNDSVELHAAVDDEGLAGHVVRIGARQERDRGRDVLRIRQTTHGDVLGEG